MKKVFSLVLAIVMMLSVSVSASATGYTVDDIPRVIYDNPDEMGLLPPVEIDTYFGNPNGIMPRDYGVGEVIPRVRTWQTASTGLYRCGSKTGTYLSVAGFALPFAGTIPAMTVGTILSAVGLGVDIINNNTSVKAETYVSYRYTYRDGEGRWSSEPNQDEYYFLGYRTGMQETFKHVMGGVLDPNTNRWSTESRDYPTAAATEKSPHYDDLDWILQQGKINVIWGQVYDETGW